MNVVRHVLMVLLFFSLVPSATLADEPFITPMMRRDWQRVAPEIQADIARSNVLMGLRCDAQFSAAVQGRFQQIDQEMLSLYYRGVTAPWGGPVMVTVPVTGRGPIMMPEATRVARHVRLGRAR